MKGEERSGLRRIKSGITCPGARGFPEGPARWPLLRRSLGIGTLALRPIRAAGLKLGRDGACSLELPPRSKSFRSRGEPDLAGRG